MRDPGNEVTVILDLCLRKTRSERSRDYRNYIVFEALLLFQNVFRPRENGKPAFSNSSALKGVFVMNYGRHQA